MNVRFFFTFTRPINLFRINEFGVLASINGIRVITVKSRREQLIGIRKDNGLALRGATSDYPATLVHLIYMCQNLLWNEGYNNGYYCYSIVC